MFLLTHNVRNANWLPECHFSSIRLEIILKFNNILLIRAVGNRNSPALLVRI